LTGDRTTLPTRTIGPALLWALSLLVGIVAGLGAVTFRALIAIFHNLFFLGRLSTAYDANTQTPAGPWGPFVILVPVVGGIAVVFLVKNFAPEAKGHGVPEVIDAVYYHKGFIRPIVSVVKALASALSIGSGGSVGREGPIIQAARALTIRCLASLTIGGISASWLSCSFESVADGLKQQRKR
jgi:CIC family chloride channel protein